MFTASSLIKHSCASFLLALCCLYAILASASDSGVQHTIVVHDQDGTPVKDAFVAIPSGEITTPNPELAVMDQVDVQFVPRVLAVDVGQEALFPNSDNIRHHVYSFSEPKRFELKLYEGVPKSPVLFDKPGLIVIGCNIHDSMLGYIFASPWPAYGVSNHHGEVVLSRDATSSKVAVWHPWMKDATEPVFIEVENKAHATQLTQKTIIVIETDKPKPKRSFNRLRERDDY